MKIQILLLKIKFNIYYEKKPSGTSVVRQFEKLFSKTFRGCHLSLVTSVDTGSTERADGHIENYYEKLFSKIYDYIFFYDEG